MIEAWTAVRHGRGLEHAVRFLHGPGARADIQLRMRIAYLAWCASGDDAYLERAQRDLLFLVQHAPAGHRDRMVERVTLYEHIHHGRRPFDG